MGYSGGMANNIDHAIQSLLNGASIQDALDGLIETGNTAYRRDYAKLRKRHGGSAGSTSRAYASDLARLRQQHGVTSKRGSTQGLRDIWGRAPKMQRN